MRVVALPLALVMTACPPTWQNVQMEADVAKLKADVARLQTDANANELQSVRTQIADLSATIEGLRTDLGLMAGRAETAEHNSTATQEALQKFKADLEAKLARLEEQLVGMQSTPGGGGAAPAPTESSQNGAAPAPDVASPTGGGGSGEGTLTGSGALHNETDESIYRGSIQLLDTGKYDDARAGLRRLITSYPKSDLADNAQYWIGESYYREGKFVEAALQYQEVLEKFPKGDKIPDALYKQGLAFLEAGQKAAGLETLKLLVSQHPKSRQAAEAKKKLASLKQ